MPHDRYTKYFEIDYTELSRELKDYVVDCYSSFSNDCKKEFYPLNDMNADGEFKDWQGNPLPLSKKFYDWILTQGWDQTTPVLINICW
jgi:hypothetical protein